LWRRIASGWLRLTRREGLGVRYNRVYSPGETVAGQVNIVSNGGVSHNGINIKVDGAVQLQLSANAVGVFEAFSSTIKPVVLLTLNKYAMMLLGLHVF
jgi:hypothetical protein